MTRPQMRLVAIESPLRGRVPRWCPTWLAPAIERWGRWRNRWYARQCMLDSLARGEAPYASHLLFDQPGLLDDANPDHRAAGMQSGACWGHMAEARAVYCDRGISDGMRWGVAVAPIGQIIEYRWLYPPRDTATVQRVEQLMRQRNFRRGGGGGGAA